jgi:hypothetical protein
MMMTAGKGLLAVIWAAILAQERHMARITL